MTPYSNESLSLTCSCGCKSASINYSGDPLPRREHYRGQKQESVRGAQLGFAIGFTCLETEFAYEETSERSRSHLTLRVEEFGSLLSYVQF